jgi:hypothetical protein
MIFVQAKIRKTSFFTPSPEKFVKEAVRSIGLIDETTGCTAHQIQVRAAILNMNIFTIFRPKSSSPGFRSSLSTKLPLISRLKHVKGHY